MTYAEAGVDIKGEGKAIKGLISSLKYKRKGTGAPVDLGGHFTGLIDIGSTYLSLCTDGVGSKIRIAEALQKWDTVGIDCMAMNVNDMICIGAEPLAFVDYIAVEKPDQKILKEIGKGLNEGAKQSNLTIIGGETATLPEIVNGLDLAGTCLGMVGKDSVITGREVEVGDIIIGLPSSGLHSNGFTLVRKVVEENDLSLIAPLQEVVSSANWRMKSLYPEYMKEVEEWVEIQGSRVLGDLLLTPTRIYVKEVLNLLKKLPAGSVRGMANITGGGMRNLNRIREDVGYRIDDVLPVPPVFRLVQVLGRIEEEEMYQTFNMGVGLVIIVTGSAAEEAENLVGKTGGRIIGQVVEGSGVDLPNKGLFFKGYV
jgi:phosphoribosylformylglycinamidine cyclo-ligase